MPLPGLLYMVWALWPLAAFPGGKLYAPLVFLVGLLGLRAAKTSLERREVRALLAFLAWVCLSAIWSPAETGLFSGSFAGEDFAVEAAYIRFALTMVFSGLFLSWVLLAEETRLRAVPSWILTGIWLHILIVGILAFTRSDLLVAQGEFLVPTGQSMGRNVNLLTLALPLLVGSLFLGNRSALMILAGIAAISITLAFAFMMDALAAVLAIVLAIASCGILFRLQRTGFRRLFEGVAAGLILSPWLVTLWATLAPVGITNLPVTTEQRLLIWQATVERIFEAPLMGHGINAASTWKETFASRPDLLTQLSPQFSNHQIIPNHPHNMALHLWAEVGFIGVALCALFLILIGRALPQPGQLPVGIRIMCGGVFGASIAYFGVSYSVWDESFWASIAIILSGVVVFARQVEA